MLKALKDCTKLKYVNVSCTDPVTLGLNTFENTPNLELLSIHGDLAADMGEDMFGGQNLCYYGSTNPKGSKLALDPRTTKVYVTKKFKQEHETFGGIVAGDDFNGYPCEVMTGTVCSFPGEPGLPTETETMIFTESETPSSEPELESTPNESELESTSSESESTSSKSESESELSDSESYLQETNIMRKIRRNYQQEHLLELFSDA